MNGKDTKRYEEKIWEWYEDASFVPQTCPNTLRFLISFWLRRERSLENHLPFAVFYLPFTIYPLTIRRFSFATLLLAISHLPLANYRKAFAVRHLQSSIGPSAIYHLPFANCQLPLVNCHLPLANNCRSPFAIFHWQCRCNVLSYKNFTNDTFQSF